MPGASDTARLCLRGPALRTGSVWAPPTAAESKARAAELATASTRLAEARERRTAYNLERYGQDAWPVASFGPERWLTEAPASARRMIPSWDRLLSLSLVHSEDPHARSASPDADGAGHLRYPGSGRAGERGRYCADDRTVPIRHEAISGLYFSSEAYDTYGPDHRDYKLATPIQMPDTRGWAIVEAMRDQDIAQDDHILDFSREDVERVKREIMVTDEKFQDLVAEGAIKPEDLVAEKAARSAETDEIMALIHTMTVQFSTGDRWQAPVSGKGVEPGVEPDLARHHVMVPDQRFRIVDPHFRGNAAKPQESAFHPLEPIRLALSLRSPDMQPLRITERGDKHMNPHPLAADPDPCVAKIELYLMPKRERIRHRTCRTWTDARQDPFDCIKG